MYKLCKTEQSALRQRELEFGLLEAMSARHYDEITVSDLCDRMGIPRKSFYRYFSGKDGALHALIDHTLMEYEGLILRPGITKHEIHQQLERFFGYWQGQKPLLDALARSNMCGVLVERAISIALGDAEHTLQARVSQERMELEHAMMFSVCGMMSMMVQWHHDGYASSAWQMASIAVHIMTKPLCEM